MTSPTRWLGPPLISGDWRDLSLDEAVPLLLRLARHAEQQDLGALFVDNWPTQARAMRLSFYPGWLLVEAQATLAAGGQGICSFLFGPLGVVIIDGNSAPVHWINGQGALKIKGDSKAATDYLRFFCSAVHGESGRFRVIEALAELALPSEVTSLPELGKLLDGKPRPIDILADGEDFLATAYVLYDSALFKSEFRIEPTGMVVMTDDDPIAPLPVEPEAFKSPFRVLGD
jgi:hypothetical protein